MKLNNSLPIALDCEFLKTHGIILTRAVAFVPFSSVKINNIKERCDANISNSSLSQRHLTVFGNCIILNLNPSEVMRRADVLPCGHSLAPFVKKTLVNGEKLRIIQQRYKEEEQGIQNIKEEEEEHEKIDNDLLDKNSEDIIEKTKISSSNSFSFLDFDTLCPHNIPNIRRTDKSWLRCIFQAPIFSNDFKEAANNLNHLRAYGKGRRRERSISFLLKYHPKLLQELLKESFSNVDEWCDWLFMCGNIVEKELNKISQEHKQISTSDSLLFSSFEKNNLNKNEKILYKEFKTIEEFSYELNKVWYYLAYSGVKNNNNNNNKSKFYTYGDMDAKTIQNTLQLSCCMKSKYSSRVSESLKYNSLISYTNNNNSKEKEEYKKEQIKLKPISNNLLSSPYEAKVIDITRHSLFNASGFRISTKVIPPLIGALRKTACVNETASYLLEKSAAHDPLWDAKALACISTACGIGVG